MTLHERVRIGNRWTIVTAIALVSVLTLLIAACGGDNNDDGVSDAEVTDSLIISDPWARPGTSMSMNEGSSSSNMSHSTPTAQATHASGMSGSMHMTPGAEGSVTTSAVYMKIENQGEQPQRIVEATCDAAETVELHQTSMVNGVMQMSQIASIEVAPNETVELAPGGLHIMLIGLTRDVKPGDTLKLTLKLESGEEITLEGVPVREPGT